MTVHTAPLLYDGLRWRAEGWVRVAGGRVADWGTGAPPPGAGPVERHGALIPGLVDACARITGYFNRMIEGDALAPHRACLAMCAEAGVTVVLGVGGHTEPYAALDHLARPGDPLLLWTGPVLDGPPVTTTATRLVHDGPSARRAVAAVAAEGARLVRTGAGLDPGPLAEVVAAARERGMPVLHQPGRTGAAEAVRAGVRLVQDLPRCLLPPAAGRPAAAAVRAFADPAVRSAAAERLRVLTGEGAAIVPLLHSWRRSALLEEAVAEPRLERLVPVAPFHRYLLDMRGPGLVFGRRYAREHFGFEHLKGAARREFDDGWAFLLDALATAHGGGAALVAGSDALGLSLVPGYGLYDELAWWERAGLDRRTVLAAATGGALDALAGHAPPRTPWASGLVALPGDPDTLPGPGALPAACRVLAGAGETVRDRVPGSADPENPEDPEDPAGSVPPAPPRSPQEARP
ncbi:hypothetical protein V1L54_15985 [Streptomyces sp. TRM 70361]|uniref:hypothetical protein n=1 Tax=Streptomyces sp. TRM 70361 TaxID=3116553 RepID=UPI002E7C2675|nr:hypothetical protein [Streptomyces sp. TRM 70361]MEE1940886.1 hypothetical protein [Streptomyces sp. TRM 70361]